LPVSKYTFGYIGPLILVFLWELWRQSVRRRCGIQKGQTLSRVKARRVGGSCV